MKLTPIHDAVRNLRNAAQAALDKMPATAQFDHILASIPSRDAVNTLALIVKDVEGADTAKSLIGRGIKLVDIPYHDLNRVAHEAKDCIIGSLRSAQVEMKERHNVEVSKLEATIRQKDETISSVTRMKLFAQQTRDQANESVTNLSRELVDARRELENFNVALAALLTTIGGQSTQDLIVDAKAAINVVKQMKLTIDTLRNQISADKAVVLRGGVTDTMRTMVLAELRERLALPADDEGRIGPDDALDDLIAVRAAAPSKTPDAECPTNGIPEYDGCDQAQGTDDIRYAPMDIDTISLTASQIETVEDRTGKLPPTDLAHGRMWMVKRENVMHLCWWVSGPGLELGGNHLAFRMKSASRRIVEVAADDLL